MGRRKFSSAQFVGRRSVSARVSENMNTFNELSKLVLLGTERQPPPAPAPGDALTAQLDPRNREHFVLSAAAIAFQYERAGALAPRDASPEPEPCPAEEQPRTSHRAANALQSLFEGERGELLPEWLRLAANARQVALPEVLPGLLTLGATKPELRDAILPVLGERGRWLAKQNAAWTWPAGAADEESVWDTGEAPVRALFLQRLSRTNPSRARELVSSTWATDPPEERAAFLRAFAFGLSPA